MKKRQGWGLTIATKKVVRAKLSGPEDYVGFVECLRIRRLNL